MTLVLMTLLVQLMCWSQYLIGIIVFYILTVGTPTSKMDTTPAASADAA